MTFCASSKKVGRGEVCKGKGKKIHINSTLPVF